MQAPRRECADSKVPNLSVGRNPGVVLQSSPEKLLLGLELVAKWLWFVFFYFLKYESGSTQVRELV